MRWLKREKSLFEDAVSVGAAVLMTAVTRAAPMAAGAAVPVTRPGATKLLPWALNPVLMLRMRTPCTKRTSVSAAAFPSPIELVKASRSVPNLPGVD